MIIAGALDTDARADLAAFSNRAGIGPAHVSRRARPARSAPSTILAPASFIRAPASRRRSSAARSALMAQAFPNLTRPADRRHPVPTRPTISAPPGTDAIFGHGRLNIQRAFQPIGTTDASPAPGPRSRRPAPSGALPAAAGDGGQKGTELGDDHPRRLFARLRARPRARRSKPPSSAAARAGAAGRSPHEWR